MAEERFTTADFHTVVQKLGVSSRTERAIRASEFLAKSYRRADSKERPF